MKHLGLFLTASALITGLFMVGCGPAAPAAAPTTAAPAAIATTGAPKAVAEPTKAMAEPTKAAVVQPTAVPAPKIAYPEKGKSITMIVPFSAGGPTDVGARLLAVAMEKELGVPVAVENKAGAGGQVGATDLALSKPDGYTIGMTNLPSTITPYLDPSRKAQYGRKDLVQVANHAWDPEGLAVGAKSPFKTTKELVDAAKTKPGEIKVGTSGLLNDTHLALLLFQKDAGVKFNIVHFDGSAQELPALIGGHIDAAAGSASALPPLIKAGEARLLGILDKQESKFFPGVPTMESQGYNVVMASSRGISVPAGTPKEIVTILEGAMKKAMGQEDHIKKLEDMALSPFFMDSVEYTKYWDELEAQTKPLLEQALQETK